MRKHLFVLVEVQESFDFSVRVCVEGFSFLAEHRRECFRDALAFAHTAFDLPVMFGQSSDENVLELYRKLSENEE